MKHVVIPMVTEAGPYSVDYDVTGHGIDAIAHNALAMDARDADDRHARAIDLRMDPPPRVLDPRDAFAVVTRDSVKRADKRRKRVCPRCFVARTASGGCNC